VAGLPGRGAPDRNTILNAIWIFPAGEPPRLDQVIAGRLNALAIRRVDVGGKDDQSIYPPGKLEYDIRLAPGESRELTFFAACRGGSAPVPGLTAWTGESLLRAARDVWRDWKD